jgi:hypothetical protein
MKTATFFKVFDMHLERARGSLVPEYVERQNRRFFKIKELPNADIPNTYVCLLSLSAGQT